MSNMRKLFKGRWKVLYLLILTVTTTVSIIIGGYEMTQVLTGSDDTVSPFFGEYLLIQSSYWCSHFL